MSGPDGPLPHGSALPRGSTKPHSREAERAVLASILFDPTEDPLFDLPADRRFESAIRRQPG